MSKLRQKYVLQFGIPMLVVSLLIAACTGGQSTVETLSPTVAAATATLEPPTATAMPEPVVMATKPEATATSAPDGISDEALVYLQEALDIIEEHSFMRHEIDWPQLRGRALDRAAGAQEPADTYQAIEWALRELDDHHSRFLAPDEAERRTRPDDAALMPTGQMIGSSIGYLWLPGMHTGGDDRERYTTITVDLIRQHDEAGACGWIVDLRDNTGGNMWPMIAGLGPIIGDGIVGYFVAPDHSRMVWTYMDGAAMLNGDIRQEGPTYQLREPTPPVAVLTGRRTGSSGEAVVVAFRGREHSRSFGRETYGVPTSNGIFPLSDGAWILLTTAEMADRDGNTYNSPIPPDVETSMNRSAGLEEEPVVVAAVEWLHTQPACH